MPYMAMPTKRALFLVSACAGAILSLEVRLSWTFETISSYISSQFANVL